MSGATEIIGNTTVGLVGTAGLVAVQTAGTHVGMPSANFSFLYGGATLSFIAGNPFIADAGLYAALQACATASALLTWTN